MRSLLMVLLVVVTLSAISMVYFRHQHRISYVALQSALQERDQLNIEWGQLLLEQSTWSVHYRVETEAGKLLGLVAPAPEKIIVLRVQE